MLGRMRSLVPAPAMTPIKGLVAGLLLVLGACVPEAIHPLSDVADAKVDQRLAGPWFAHIDGEDVHAHFVPQSDGWTAIVTVSYRKSGDNGDWMVFRMVPARIGNGDYMSVQFVAQDGEPEPQKTYFPIHYRLSAEGVLGVWRMSDETAMAAIEGGLPGSVKKGRWTNTTVVTATTAQWAAFLKDADPEQLFPVKIGGFRHPPPAQ